MRQLSQAGNRRHGNGRGVAFAPNLCYILKKEDAKDEGLMQKRLPLGHIELEDGKKPVYAFDDFFLNYTFENKDNWEALRLIINILLEAYTLECPRTVLEPITDDIIVTTQFKNYMKNQHKPNSKLFAKGRINRKAISQYLMHHVCQLEKTFK